ncbi:alcohol dehydrogenase [Exophiala aquamarina CBS 119918]|uniref:Alcohol dehydrogenase n=1 Tax=Exophiala aquamarina CBS 119918 TaxID=1182545 RepID=A0A072PM07_9EURO|nr:alcohol dehydrogenase [Exophiala aquamarina CBS 119918]KEF60906.1 alcohol dehydrogenase [Exophiala aquamarina CBS 119918]
MGVRLSDEISPDQVNYGQLQVTFEDGSVGWYDAGWGPMISETAYFVKAVFGPRGHTRTSRLRMNHVSDGKDKMLSMSGEQTIMGFALSNSSIYLRQFSKPVT